MTTRVSFADLLKKGTEKDEQRSGEKPGQPDKKAVLRTPGTPLTPLTTSTAHPISPERDFAKVANSIVREAVAQGMFIGKSKQIYDFLYLHTRGAIQPKRSVRITKSILMRGANIGSERTLLKNLSHLKKVGLVKITEFEGQHQGNEYQVLLPEECRVTPPTPPTAQQPDHTLPEVGTLPSVGTSVGGVGQIEQNKGAYSTAKTSFKDNTTNDDETRRQKPFSKMIERLDEATQKITGRKSSGYEADKWADIADLLILELEIAVSRTGDISSVPGFLTEVLRRRFFNSRQKPSALRQTTAKTDTVGKPGSDSYQTKMLNEKERAEALDYLREFADEGFLPDFKKWYLDEDWKWLMENL